MSIFDLSRYLLLFAFAACVPLSAQEGSKYPFPKNPTMVFETTSGVFEVLLYPDAAPLACENFIRLAQESYYNGIIFHRIIKGFMIQGGDPTGTGRGGDSIWKKTFKDEYSPSHLFDRPGLLAMANRGPGTNGSQFFITTGEAPWLNYKHTIFGEVVKGKDVIKTIESCVTDRSDRPVVEQKMLKVYLKQE